MVPWSVVVSKRVGRAVMAVPALCESWIGCTEVLRSLLCPQKTWLYVPFLKWEQWNIHFIGSNPTCSDNFDYLNSKHITYLTSHVENATSHLSFEETWLEARWLIVCLINHTRCWVVVGHANFQTVGLMLRLSITPCWHPMRTLTLWVEWQQLQANLLQHCILTLYYTMY